MQRSAPRSRSEPHQISMRLIRQNCHDSKKGQDLVSKLLGSPSHRSQCHDNVNGPKMYSSVNSDWPLIDLVDNLSSPHLGSLPQLAKVDPHLTHVLSPPCSSAGSRVLALPGTIPFLRASEPAQGDPEVLFHHAAINWHIDMVVTHLYSIHRSAGIVHAPCVFRN